MVFLQNWDYLCRSTKIYCSKNLTILYVVFASTETTASCPGFLCLCHLCTMELESFRIFAFKRGILGNGDFNERTSENREKISSKKENYSKSSGNWRLKL